MKFDPIIKLRLFQSIKKIIHTKLEKGTIELKRAEEVMDYVKENIVLIDTSEKAKLFCDDVAGRFEELQMVKNKFEAEEKEKFALQFSRLLDTLMEEDLEKASQIMEQMEQTTDQQQLLQDLKQQYPDAF